MPGEENRPFPHPIPDPRVSVEDAVENLTRATKRMEELSLDPLQDPARLLPDYLRGCPPGEIAAKLGIPPAYAEAELGDFDRDEVLVFGENTMTPISDAGGLEKLVAEGPESLLVQGANGSGKSHLAAAIAKRWGARWCTMIKILLRVRRSFHIINPASGDKSELGIIEEFSAVPRLVIDDITAMNTTDFGLSTALAILSERIDQKLPTIVTSFMRLDDLEKKDSSIASRLGGFVPLMTKFNGHPSGDRRQA